MSLRTCNKCGWVHMGVTRAYAENQVREFNTYYESLPKEGKEMFGGYSTMDAYLNCWCGNTHQNTRESKDGDCPDGCTIGPILLPDE